MKIPHIPNAYFPVIGGTDEILASQGHDVHVVTADVGAVQAPCHVNPPTYLIEAITEREAGDSYYEFGIPRVERADEIIGGVAAAPTQSAHNQGKSSVSAATGLQDRVILAGCETSVERIWAENHVLVMASRAEGLPMAIVEAMLCARPVVATDVAGHAQIIKDGATGFLADAPTVPSVATALEKLWVARENLETIGSAAAKSIRELVPSDPVSLFVKKLLELICSKETRKQESL